MINLIKYGTGERTGSLKHPTKPPFPTAKPAATNLALKAPNRQGSPIKSSDLQIKELKGLTKDESRALLEYVARSGLLRRKVDEAFVSEMWALSGGGRAGELVRGGLRIGVL